MTTPRVGVIYTISMGDVDNNSVSDEDDIRRSGLVTEKGTGQLKRQSDFPPQKKERKEGGHSNNPQKSYAPQQQQ